VGSYDSVKQVVCGELGEGENPALYQKVLAAMITGAIGITVANPTDVVKVRLQNQTKSAHFKTKGVWYKGTIDCYQKTITNEGIAGLWTSWSANVVRNSIINAAEIASYD